MQIPLFQWLQWKHSDMRNCIVLSISSWTDFLCARLSVEGKSDRLGMLRWNLHEVNAQLWKVSTMFHVNRCAEVSSRPLCNVNEKWSFALNLEKPPRKPSIWLSWSTEMLLCFWVAQVAPGLEGVYRVRKGKSNAYYLFLQYHHGVIKRKFTSYGNR